ncbi:glycosyltransferase family 39 protein [Acutalibacter caecimuris]|uniref:glycosyltransferase family 39 protein n=1 Tax=Acutalibacter caecimuris TaxID=3093657 RepID=UPI002AC9E41E|nr:glycosyltransferase family 39 protein [Acutalibacter sp. M00118]
MHLILAVPVLGLMGLVAVRCLMAWGVPSPLPAAFFAGKAPTPPGAYTPSRRELWKVFGLAMGIRLALLGVVALCLAMTANQGLSRPSIEGSFQLWDARHYIALIEKGYGGYQEDGKHIFLVFFPLYVWVTRLVRLVVPSTIGAGVLVSVLSYGWGCCWVYRLAGLVFGRRIAWDTVLFLSVFPFSLFFGAVMTEGLFLLTTSAACYFALRRRWLAYGIWGVLAAMTRMTGLLVIVPAFIELGRAVRLLQRPARRPIGRWLLPALGKLPLLLLPLLGTGVYLLLNWRIDGDPLAFVVHQRHWHQGGMPVPQVLAYLWHYLRMYFRQPIGWSVWLPELVLFVVCFGVLALACRHRAVPASLLGYGLLYLLANYSLSWLLSGGRYLSCGVPLFMLEAYLVKDKPVLREYLLVAQAMLLGAYLFAYINHAPVM